MRSGMNLFLHAERRKIFYSALKPEQIFSFPVAPQTTATVHLLIHPEFSGQPFLHSCMRTGPANIRLFSIQSCAQVVHGCHGCFFYVKPQSGLDSLYFAWQRPDRLKYSFFLTGLRVTGFLTVPLFIIFCSWWTFFLQTWSFVPVIATFLQLLTFFRDFVNDLWCKFKATIFPIFYYLQNNGTIRTIMILHDCRLTSIRARKNRYFCLIFFLSIIFFTEFYLFCRGLPPFWTNLCRSAF